MINKKNLIISLVSFFIGIIIGTLGVSLLLNGEIEREAWFVVTAVVVIFIGVVIVVKRQKTESI